MSKLSELLKQQEKQERPQGIEVDLSGNCTICFEDVDTAMYFPEHMVLEYVCENGHKNYLEEFRL